MKIRKIGDKRIIPCTESSWANIKRMGKDHLFEIVESAKPVTPIATKRTVTVVEVPVMPALPEEEEVKKKQRTKAGKQKPEDNE